MKDASIHIETADPQGAEAVALLREAGVEARALYPELFAPDAQWPVNAPVAPRGAFCVSRLGDLVAGCGALRPIDADTVEIKRMFVTQAARRRGVARAILAHLEELAREYGYLAIRLETGKRQQPAMELYGSCGYQRIPPFGEHVNDPTSVCFEKWLG